MVPRYYWYLSLGIPDLTTFFLRVSSGEFGDCCC